MGCILFLGGRILSLVFLVGLDVVGVDFMEVGVGLMVCLILVCGVGLVVGVILGVMMVVVGCFMVVVVVVIMGVVGVGVVMGLGVGLGVNGFLYLCLVVMI